MRRITLLALLAAVMMVVSGVAVFADGTAAPVLTFSGGVYTGIEFDGGTAVTAKLFDNNDGNASSIYLDGALNGKTVGAKFEILSKDGATVGADVLYAWWNPIDIITLSAGIGYGGIYTTPIEGWGHYAPGFQIALAPIAGLNLGADYEVGTTAAAAAGNISFGASYALPNLVTVGGGYDLMGSYAWAGVSVTAVKGLTSNLDFEDTTTAGGNMRIEAKLGYAVGALSPSVWLYYQTVGTQFGVNPAVSYALGAVTPGVGVEYDADGTITVSANAAIAVESKTVNIYANFVTPANTWKLGVNFEVGF
jgi:hypothetical protein